MNKIGATVAGIVQKAQTGRHRSRVYSTGKTIINSNKVIIFKQSW